MYMLETCKALASSWIEHGCLSQIDMDLSPGYTTDELLASVVDGF